jgi:hypothetical protein
VKRQTRTFLDVFNHRLIKTHAVQILNAEKASVALTIAHNLIGGLFADALKVSQLTLRRLVQIHLSQFVGHGLPH